MKRISLLVYVLMSLTYSNAQVKDQPRLHNWIATFMPEANAATIRHVMVMADGTLRIWKAGEKPALFPGIDNALQVAAGQSHLLILKKDGTIWALGDNGNYQLGDESLSNRKETSSETPVKVTGIDNAIAISALRNTSYALLKDGTVWAWGDGSIGRCGDGGDIEYSTVSRISGRIVPVQVKGVKNAIAISGAMALLADGTVWAWGEGSRGRLGNNSTDHTSTPVKVEGISNAVAISGRYDGAMALLADGTIKAWGNNYKGQLGNGVNKSRLYQGSKEEQSLVPVKVVNVSNVIDINADASYLALLKNGSVMGWGWGALSALGPLGGDATPTPVKVFDLKNVVAIKAGNGLGFALLKDGSLVGWGSQMVSDGPYKHSTKVITIASFGSLAPRP